MAWAPSFQPEFREVTHCGGKMSVIVTITAEGRRLYQIQYTHCRPVPAVFFAVYALPPGIPVANMDLGGIGSVPNPPPPGCFPVFIASDSEGKFGRQCPVCSGYWRSDPNAQFCPYCGFKGDRIAFMTVAQRSYIEQWWPLFDEALRVDAPAGEHAVDMDAVADAIAALEKPAFYYAEVSQQNKYTCKACGAFNDILGTFGYCTSCGTRNDLQELVDKAIPSLRDRINAGGPYETCSKEAVAIFDSFVGQYVKQLIRIPMTAARKNRLENRRFHDLASVATELKQTFDIDILAGVDPSEIDFATLMFHRRHVYEHRGGEADQKYIDDSGDKSVRVKQALRETIQSAHEIVRIVQKMAVNLHKGFHEIIRVDEVPIKRFEEQHKPRTPKFSPNLSPKGPKTPTEPGEAGDRRNVSHTV